MVLQETSFTFNSNIDMIKKTIIASIILFTIWSIFLSRNPSIDASQHQWQDNYIQAENYLFSKTKFDNVIVGSSLSKRIFMDSLAGFYNLSFNGQSTFDGLKIISEGKSKPNNVFIEINVLDRDENKTFTSSLTSKLSIEAKESNLAFRSDKQPLALLGKYVGLPIFINAHSIIKKVNKKVEGSSKTGRINNNTNIFNKMKAQQMVTNNIIIEEKKALRIIELLNTTINNLKNQNINVIFFEMPVNSKIQNLSKPLQLRALIQKKFPEIDFIPAPKESEKYKTTDGVHLSIKEAVRYTSYLKDKIKLIGINY